MPLMASSSGCAKLAVERLPSAMQAARDILVIFITFPLRILFE